MRSVKVYIHSRPKLGRRGKKRQWMRERAVERVSKKASEKRKEKWVNSQGEIHRDRMICYWVDVLLFLWLFIVGEAYFFSFLKHVYTHLTLAGMTSCLNLNDFGDNSGNK